jgi:DNA adenine methylase
VDIARDIATKVFSSSEDTSNNNSSQEKIFTEEDKHKNPPPLKREIVSILSPLRYPGSKRRLAGYINRALEINRLHPSLFVEPFAGGASVALQLLNDGMVNTIGLIDRDPLVASFWQVVFFDTDWLLHQISTIQVTLEQWEKFKQIENLKGTRDFALACLFLNRTSFSGIIAPNAGPIGGRSQTSQYTIDCRFPRETLIKRVRQAAALRDRVAFVWNTTWHNGIERIQEFQHLQLLTENVMYYFDPPFFEKANQLYTYYFKEQDHLRLRDNILALETPWILSYDVSDRVNALYSLEPRGSTHVELLYSTSSQGGSRIVSEVIISNLEQLPEETRLWKSSQEWKM